MSTRSAARPAVRRKPIERSSRRSRRASEARSTAVPFAQPHVAIGLATGALVMLGLLMILSASSVTSFATYGSSFLFVKKQLLWAAVGVVGFFLCARLDYRKLRRSGYLLLLVAIGLLVAVQIPGIGMVVGGSARWLKLGPLSFQPSELAKLGLILFTADVFARRKEPSFVSMRDTVVPMLPVLGVLSLLIMLQPDLGTTLLVGAIGMGMLFVAGAPLRHLLPIIGGAIGVAAVAAMAAPYRRARIFAFLNPWADPLDSGYQTIQSLIALGSGGWFGVGLGASRQKWLYVPNAHTDFIYAILGEEMGLVGTLVVWGLFGLIAYMGIAAARRAPDRFGMLVAAGITIWVSTQAIVNVGAVTASLPVTGVPLPLVSFGGSSLVVLLCAMGILTSVAKARRPRRSRAA